MRVKVGLETSSGGAAPRPFTMPLAIVVLPAPRLPISRTAARAGSSPAMRSPRAMVSSSDAVRYSATLLHRVGQVLENVARDQALLAQRARAGLAGESVE